MSDIDDHFSETAPGAVVASCCAAPRAGATDPVPAGCEYLDKHALVDAPSADFDRIRKTVKLDEGTDTYHLFPGDATASPATEYVASVDGRDISIITPKAAPVGKVIPSVDQIASALGTVPGKQLDSFKQVVISPNANPSDAYWAEQYNTPGFTSGATGGPDGVTFYPTDAPSTQSYLDGTAIHEGGHAFADGLWKDPAVQKQWTDAIASDGVSPSTYADSSPGEDFSESLVMYSLSKGTKCEAAAKTRYPARYKALDGLFEDAPDDDD